MSQEWNNNLDKNGDFISLAPKKEIRDKIKFSDDWQTEFICRRYCEIEDVLMKYNVTSLEDLEKRLGDKYEK